MTVKCLNVELDMTKSCYSFPAMLSPFASRT
jgi:hypothetical protein